MRNNILLGVALTALVGSGKSEGAIPESLTHSSGRGCLNRPSRATTYFWIAQPPSANWERNRTASRNLQRHTTMTRSIGL